MLALEKRGYVKMGPSTPEAVIENPEAGKKLVLKKLKLNYFFQKNLILASNEYKTRHSY